MKNDSTNVRVTITGGRYKGRSFEGSLAAAPVTFLVPEGIVSARTTEEAARLRSRIQEQLQSHDRVEVSRPDWAYMVERAEVA